MATSKENAARKIQSFVLFDTETTGLPSVGNNPRITELCFLALTRDELTMESAAPRVMCKLCLCFNPMKMISPASVRITGLHNDSLEQLASFKTQASLVCQFLQNLPKPACLVAHNGNSFDFPLLVSHLRASLQKVPEGVLCADSLEAFRTFDGLPPVPNFVCRGDFINKEGLQVSKPESSTVLRSPCALSEDQMDNVIVYHNDETQDPNEAQFSPSSCRKRFLEDNQQSGHDKLTSDNEMDVLKPSDFSDKSAAHWDASGFSTPAKKMQRVEPDAPTKRAVFSPQSDATVEPIETEPRHNLLKTFSQMCESGESDSQQTLAYSQSETKVNAVGLLKSLEDACNGKTLGQGGLYEGGGPQGGGKEHFHREEIDLKTENSSQPDCSLCRFPSLTEECEGLLLEAVEQAELMEAERLNISSNAGREKETLSNEKSNGLPKGDGKLSSEHTIQGNANRSGGTPQKVSYSLPKIYLRVFGQEPQVSHTAEDDCRTLLQTIQCSAKHKFPTWCDQNAVPLRSIRPMF